MHEHTITVRVRYREVDRQDVVYHGNYFTWFDMGRTEFIRALGVPYKEMEDRGVMLVVTRADIRYLAGARLDDELTVTTRVLRRTKSRVTFGYEVVRPIDGKLMTTGSTELACLDAEGRSRRLPPEFAGVEVS